MLVYKGLFLSREEVLFVSIALYHQFFFLMYCTSGNPLYDFNCYYTFFVSVALIEAIKYFRRKEWKEVLYEDRNINLVFGINYGARAHSLALYQTVRNLGYDCEFIQYTSSNTIKRVL